MGNDVVIVKELERCMEIVRGLMDISLCSDSCRSHLIDVAKYVLSDSGEGETILDIDYDDVLLGRVSSFSFVLQLVIYHLVSLSIGREDMQALSLSVVSDCFKGVKEITGWDYGVFEKIDVNCAFNDVDSASSDLEEVIGVVSSFSISDFKTDILGKLYHSLLPMVARKPQAVFYTSNSSALLLASLSIEGVRDVVADLSCGSGSLLKAAYNVKCSMSPAGVSVNELVSDIYGNDLNSFACLLTRLNLSLTEGTVERDSVHVTSKNGLLITAKGYKRSVDIRRYFDADIGGDVPLLDVLLMNPPFSRRMSMGDDLRVMIEGIVKRWWASSRERETYVYGDMGLHFYFIYHSNTVLRKGARLAMIVPSSTFASAFSKRLLRFLSTNFYSVDYIIEKIGESSVFSEDCNYREFMVILSKGMLRDGDKTKMVTFDGDFHVDDVSEIVSFLDGTEGNDKFVINGSVTVKVREVESSYLYSVNDWAGVFVPEIEEIDSVFDRESKSFISVNDYVMSGSSGMIEVVEGYTGAYIQALRLPNNEWGVIDLSTSDKCIIYKKGEGNESKRVYVDRRYMVKAIGKGGDIIGHKFASSSYLLSLPYPLPEGLSELRSVYLAGAFKEIERKFDHDRESGRYRKSIPDNWFSEAVQNGASRCFSHLFFRRKYGFVARRSLCFFSEEATSAADRLYMIRSVDDEFYASWYSSSLFMYFLLRRQRTVSTGYYALSKFLFESFPVPVYSSFDKEVILILKKSWSVLAGVDDDDLPLLHEQFYIDYLPRSDLDRAWLLALGVPSSDIDSLLLKLYSWIREYISTR